MLDDELDRGLSCVDDARELDDEFRDVAEPLSDEENVKRRNEDDFDDEAEDEDIFWLFLASAIVIRRLNGTRSGIATSAREQLTITPVSIASKRIPRGVQTRRQN